ncbi:MAG: hypothetical protein OXI63_13820 [Candidatus Poribacteria bacterium]|nr:hypothetical protein [Candidatus Poribacteria bacterium]
MPELEWWQWVLGLTLTGVGLLFGTLAFKVALTFNVTEWLERRDRKWEQRIRFCCPHVEVYKENGQFMIRGLMRSPFGTTQAFCTQCGQVFIGGEDEGREWVEYYSRNHDEYFAKMKAFQKLTRKVQKL